MLPMGRWANAAADLDFAQLQTEAFTGTPNTSIDDAVIERATQAGTPADSFAQSVVGTRDAVWQVLERDDKGNAVRGPGELVNTTAA